MRIPSSLAGIHGIHPIANVQHGGTHFLSLNTSLEGGGALPTTFF
jgi:hypothetical protein